MLTRKDLMKRWDVSERTLDRWIKSKGVPCKKNAVNGRVYFNEEEIQVWESKMLVGKKG